MWFLKKPYQVIVVLDIYLERFLGLGLLTTIAIQAIFNSLLSSLLQVIIAHID